MDKNMNKYSNTKDATYFLGPRVFSCQSKFRAYVEQKVCFMKEFQKFLFLLRNSRENQHLQIGNSEVIPTVYF